jgi:hypothetical protein
MARTANDIYQLTGLAPNTPANVIHESRRNWHEVVKPILLDDARRVNGPKKRNDRQQMIQLIDEAYFDLLTAKQRRHSRSRH